MNCFSSGAVVRTGGSQSCIDGAPSVKYSAVSILLEIDKIYSPFIIIMGGIIVTIISTVISVPFVKIKKSRKKNRNQATGFMGTAIIDLNHKFR